MQIRCVKNEKLIPNTGEDDGKVVLCMCSMLNDEACLHRDCEAVGFDPKRNKEIIKAMSGKIEADGPVDFDMRRPDRIVPHRFDATAYDRVLFNGADTPSALKDHLKTGSALQSQAGVPQVLRAEARAIMEGVKHKASKTVLAGTKLYREYVFMREVPLRDLDDPTKEPWVDDVRKRE